MAKTIKELAKEMNCSYEAVRKQTKRYAKELKDHIYTQHKTQYLDDFACDFLNSKRMNSPVVVSRIELDEAVEKLKEKYTELLEAHNQLKDEKYALEEANRLLLAETARIALLEADNEAQRVKIAETEKKASEDVQKAKNEFEAEKKKLEDENHLLQNELQAEKQRRISLKEFWHRWINKE